MKTGPFAPRKPQGQPTRGKTAANRLRRVDNFVLLYEPSLLTRADDGFAGALFVDLGYGQDARTTLESAARFRRVNSGLGVLGVEIDPERVGAALPYVDGKTFFRLGGFNLPLQAGETVRLVRAFNVLRQYPEADFLPAYERLAGYVLPGGLMIEGTSTPFGQLWAANLVRRKAAGTSDPGSADRLKKNCLAPDWDIEALVFSTNFRMGFDPAEFQTILPKNLIHRVVPGEPIHDFFEAWKRAAAETIRSKAWGNRQWFIAAAEGLAAKGFEINLQKRFIGKGWLVWERPAL
jgi:hypothetical protein